MDYRFVPWENIYATDMEGQGVASDTHGPSAEGYSNEVGDKHGVEEGEKWMCKTINIDKYIQRMRCKWCGFKL